MPGGYLEFDAISKRFGSVTALDNVSFQVGEGSVHALLGENGAGKSTLLKILSGVHVSDGGCIRLAGQPQRFRSAVDAIEKGVSIIYQELHLVPNMSVAENILLGHFPNRASWIDKADLLRRAADHLGALDAEIDVSAKVSSLSIAQRQVVEIAKALSRDAKVIAFDEPTSSLSEREVKNLFSIIRELRDRGRVVLYVSHRLDEIFEIADSATVLRDGKHIKTFDTLEGIDTSDLVSNMVGRSITDVYSYAPREHADSALSVDGIMGLGLARPVSLDVAKGEIVGIFGLVGAGRSELLKLICGAARSSGGAVRIDGRPVSIRTPGDAIANGLVLCPEDRKKQGLIPIQSVAENINLSARRNFVRLGFFLNERRERRNAEEQISRLRIKTPSPFQKIANLSGGNQQKTILARWLSEDISVMLMDEPTRGIDVGAKSEIYSTIYELASRGVGVLVVSSELPEIMGICDRILVMRQGRLVASLDRNEATQEKILSLALPVGAQ